MPGCVLHVGGKSFNPDTFLDHSKIQAYSIWHIGEPISKRRPDPARVYKNSGFKCDVSPDDRTLRKQIKVAEAFLIRYRADFLLIAAQPGVEFCDLDFGYYCRIGEPNPRHGNSVVAMQGEYLPNSFLRLAGEMGVGVALSLYPDPEEDEDSSTSISSLP
jgi:hypothetical protein